MFRTSLAVGLLAAAASAPAALAAPLPTPTEAGRFSLDRALVLAAPTLTDASPIIAGGGIREGGLSALQVVPGTGNRRFVTITDRGPNGQPTNNGASIDGRTFPTPGFSPTIMELQADDDGRLSVLRRLQIRVPGADPLRGAAAGQILGDPQLITGLRNVVTPLIDDKMFFMANDTSLAEYLPTDPYGLDTEGIAVDPRDGSYWISEEYRPSIARLTPGGVMRQRIVPVGAGSLNTNPDSGTPAVPLSAAYGGANQPSLQSLLPREFSARKLNRGMEGLTISPDGRTLYGIMQNPLDTRAAGEYVNLGYGVRCNGATVAGNVQTSQNFYRGVRIVKFDISDASDPKLTGEYVYRLQSISTTNATDQGKLRISDLAWSATNKLLVVEHDDDASGHGNRKVFEADLSQATNLQTASGLSTYSDRSAALAAPGNTQPVGCFLDRAEQTDLDALAAAGTPVTPAAKTLYLDLSPQGVDFEFNKVEGLTKLEGVDGVAIVNDNDFALSQANIENRQGQTPSLPIISEATDPRSELRIYATKPTETTAPSISGTATAGRTLTCAPGAVTGTGTTTNTYAWLRGGTPISGADSARYVLSTEDVGQAVTCRVVTTRQFGAVKATAAARTSTATSTVADFEKGATGSTGAQGVTGGQGATGPQGVTGAQGATGATGAAGTNGTNGATGPKGDAGTNGINGATGAAGVTGAVGAAGPKGDAGAQGPIGPKGADGINKLPRVTCKLKSRSTVSCTVKPPLQSTKLTVSKGKKAIKTVRTSRGKTITLTLPRGATLTFRASAGGKTVAASTLRAG